MSYSQKRHEVFSKIEPWLFLSPFLIFIIIFTLYPVINVFTISFKENYSYLRGTFKAINFENYKYVLTDDKFTSGLKIQRSTFYLSYLLVQQLRFSLQIF